MSWFLKCIYVEIPPEIQVTGLNIREQTFAHRTKVEHVLPYLSR